MGKVWAISTNKGGVLKTSLTTNLAGVLSKGNRVLILDMDNQSNVLVSFGKNPDALETSIYDVLVQGEDPKKAIINVYDNIDVLPSNDDMAFFEFDVLMEREKYPKPFFLLKEAIERLKQQYDYILIDSPPNMGLTTGSILTAANEVLIPFQPETYSMRSLLKIIKSIEDFKSKHNPSLSILGVVATLVDTRTIIHTQVLQECRKFCHERGIRLFDTVIPRSVRFASNVAFERLPSTLAEPNHSVVSCYFDLWKEMNENGQKK